MGTTLAKMPFPKEAKVTQIYKSKELESYTNEPIRDQQISDMYGELKFGELHKDRPYTLATFVTSIDGRIAFSDDPQGPLIAKKNKLDPIGATSDWWILNMVRSCVDGIIVGTGTINAEAEFTGYIYDEKLEKARVREGMSTVPWYIVMSLDGTDIPYEHEIFYNDDLPIMICTSQKGMSYVTSHIQNKYVVIDADMENSKKLNRQMLNNVERGTIIIIVTGEEIPDSPLSFRLLKRMGIDRLLVETPTYMHYLLAEGLIDELFLNYSCLYLGGKALTLGQSGKEFTSEEHPHTKVLSIHTHSDNFFYFRHRVVYEA